MTEQLPSATDEAERIALLRDPPAPPGYVDPLEGSRMLHDGLTTDTAEESGRQAPGPRSRRRP